MKTRTLYHSKVWVSKIFI